MMKAAQLRQAILQAAVQGKLVPQNPHDEPASVLLERIRSEKAKRKLKQEKPLSLIAEDEVPYELPNGWMWCRLSEVVTLHNGRAYKKQELLDVGATPVLRVGNLFTSSKWYFSDLQLDEDKYCNKGDLLYAWSASFGPHIWTGNKVIYHYHIWKLSLVFPEMKEYIYYTLLEQTQEIKNSGHGLAMIHVTKENTEKGYFPLPPLAEQKLIVAKIKELMAMCDELETVEKASDTLDEHLFEYLPKSILQAAVQGRLVPQNPHDESASVLLERIRSEKTKLVKAGILKKDKPLPPIVGDEMPYNLPDGWTWCRLGDVCITNPRNNLPDNIEVTFTPMALISNTYNGGHSGEDRIWKDIKGGFTHYAENDIAVAKITPCFQNGKSCVMRNLRNGYGAGTTELHVLRTVIIMPEYLLIFVKHPYFLIEGEKNMTGTAGQQRVPTDFLRNFPFPLPPLSEQQRIVAKVDELMALCAKLKTVAENVEIPEAKQATIIPLGRPHGNEPLRMAARGRVNEELSEAHKKAREDMFNDD